jgi:phosphomethylpyrimidine synthase
LGTACPECLADATDKAQLHELKCGGTHPAGLGQGCSHRRKAGHLPLNAIQKNVRLPAEALRRRPFYVLGPLVTDVASSYDHIAGAIGGPWPPPWKRPFCYVTPAEHLKLPEVEDVIDGVVASRIAAHAADIANGIPGAADWDLKMSQARRALDWQTQIQLSVNPDKARRYRDLSQAKDDQCTMCGKFCAMKVYDDSLRAKEQSPGCGDALRTRLAITKLRATGLVQVGDGHALAAVGGMNHLTYCGAMPDALAGRLKRADHRASI